MLRNLSISLRLHVMVLMLLASVLVVAAIGLMQTRDRLLAERQQQCRMLVASALGLLAQFELRARFGTLSQDEAQAQAIHAIAAMSIGHQEYLWVNDLHPNVVWHPSAEWVGRDVSQTRDADGRLLFREMVERTQQGGAFVAYQWPKPGETNPTPKVSYVERFEPWGWVVGSGLYVDDLEAAWRHAALEQGKLAAGAALVAALVVWLLAQSVTGPLGMVTRSMRRLAKGEDVAVPETARRDEIGELTRAMAVFKASIAEREITRRAHEQVLRQTKTVFDHISEGVMVTDSSNRIRLVNPSFTRITGFLPEEVIGHTPRVLSSGRHDETFYRTLWATLKEKGEWQGEIWNRTKHGEIFPESLSITVMKGPDGVVEGYIATFQDITDRVRREARVRWRAEHDQLTGLHNRAQFEARLADFLRLAREDGTIVALLYVDLDGFKPINDSLGHHAGDLVLKRTAKRLRAQVRGADVVARLGGDEFAMVVPGLAHGEDVARIAANLVESVAEPIKVGDCEVRVGASIGVALFPEHAGTLDDLVAAADHAMYCTKRQGRNGFTFFHWPGAAQSASTWADVPM